MATGGCALLFLGLILGNFPYLLFGGLLAAAAFTSRLTDAPLLKATRDPVLPPHVIAGEVIEQRVRVQAPAAGEVLTLHDAIPDAFVLDAGRNFRVSHGGESGSSTLDYRLRAARRGVRELGPLTAAFPDPLFVVAARERTLLPPSEVVVQARAAHAVRRLRSPRAWGVTAFPGGDQASRGSKTNDFRELRPYAPGDPLKLVNWKATARASMDEMRLIVNDHEVEGKKAVWVFLDASHYTVAGTSLRSAFDELADGALAIAEHFLDRGHRVGMTLYGGPEPRILYAESGDAQSLRIRSAITYTEPATQPGQPFHAAVQDTRGFLVRERPLVFALTLMGRDATLEQGLFAARALASTGRRPGTVMLLVPDTREDADAPDARLASLDARAQLAGLRRGGISAALWHPERAPLAALLSKGVIR